jgi:ribosomal protein L7/L12
MLGSLGKKEAHLVALSDLDEAREAVRQALAGASAAEEPGLRAALGILDGFAGSDPRVRWVAQVLGQQGIDPRTHEVAAIKALRDALPGLGLASAAELVREAKQAV